MKAKKPAPWRDTKQARWNKRNPWARHLTLARYRCRTQDPESPWFGTECRLDMDDVRRLYVRDGAAKMKRPCLDRIKTPGDYTVSNCRFIEFVHNWARALAPEMGEALEAAHLGYSEMEAPPF